MSYVLAGWLFGFCVLAALIFFVRLLCSTFSREVRASMFRHPVKHYAWGIFSMITALLWLSGFNPLQFLSNVWETRSLRIQMAQRALSAGGWEAVRRDCLLLMATNETFRWTRSQKNEANILPPALAVLKPQEVYCDVSVVHLKIFGMHSTGGHSTPYIGVDVVVGPVGETSQPKLSAAGHTSRHYSKLSDGVFEIY